MPNYLCQFYDDKFFFAKLMISSLCNIKRKKLPPFYCSMPPPFFFFGGFPNLDFRFICLLNQKSLKKIMTKDTFSLISFTPFKATPRENSDNFPMRVRRRDCICPGLVGDCTCSDTTPSIYIRIFFHYLPTLLSFFLFFPCPSS